MTFIRKSDSYGFKPTVTNIQIVLRGKYFIANISRPRQLVQAEESINNNIMYVFIVQVRSLRTPCYLILLTFSQMRHNT